MALYNLQKVNNFDYMTEFNWLSFLHDLAILPAMLEQGSGQIVVISSLQGKIGLPLRSSCELVVSNV